MLDTDTKRRIDTARDILVGKVPDPKSQVEQITIALIYKSYSGVKTSILILDKSLAKQSDRIGFKVENDGYNLGAQRRAIEKNDMPQVKTELTAFLDALRNRSTTDELAFSSGLIVPKEKNRGEWRLQPERGAVSGSRSEHKHLPDGQTRRSLHD